jgi:hypothetical protein
MACCKHFTVWHSVLTKGRPIIRRDFQYAPCWSSEILERGTKRDRWRLSFGGRAMFVLSGTRSGRRGKEREHRRKNWERWPRWRIYWKRCQSRRKQNGRFGRVCEIANFFLLSMLPKFPVAIRKAAARQPLRCFSVSGYLFYCEVLSCRL